MSRLVYGVDFSGGAAAWRAGCRRPSVWIATLDLGGARPRLFDLRPVQDLPGPGAPFDRLVALLREGAYAAAGIDAPLSLPARHLPAGTQAGLLAALARLPDAEDRPFPRGADLMELAAKVAPLARPKPRRACERIWGVNTRSTLWNGPRGGAPFAAASLRLVERSGRPCWPWSGAPGGLLVEAFPAAQLRHWRLPHTGYGRPDGAAFREAILTGLRTRVDLRPDAADRMRASPDALDAVIAAFAAIAVIEVKLAIRPDLSADSEEGWIAVQA